MKGVAIGSNIGGPPLNDPRFEPLWAKLDAMRLPVFEHPMFPRTRRKWASSSCRCASG